MRTAARWLLRLFLGATVLVLLLVVAVLVGTRSPAVHDLLRRELVTRLGRELHATVGIGAIRGSLLRTLVVEDVRVAVDGRTVIRVPRLEASFTLRSLLAGELRVEHVALTQPRVRLVRKGGKWLLPAPDDEERDRERGRQGVGLAIAVALERVAIEDGRVAIALLDEQPARRFAATQVAVEGNARIQRARQTFEVTRLAFVPRGIAVRPVDATLAGSVERGGLVQVSRLVASTGRSRLAVSGTVGHDQGLDAYLTLSPLAAADVRALAPGSGVRADVRGHLEARGPWRALAAVGRADFSTGGTIAARGTVDVVASPPTWTSRFRLAGVDPGAAVEHVPSGWLQGHGDLAGHGFALGGPLRYALTLQDSRLEGRDIQRFELAGRAAAGVHRFRSAIVAPLGEATVRGRLALDEPLRYRARTRYTVARLDLLVPSTWGWVMGEADIRGRGTAPRDRRARLNVGVRGASVHGLPVNRAELRARLDGSDLQLERFALDAPEVHVEGRGRADVDRLTGELSANGNAGLGTVGAYLGQPLAGRATVALDGRGALNDLTAEATATLEQPSYDRVSAGPTTARVRAAGIGGPAPGGDLHFEAADLRVGTDAPYATRGDVTWRRQGREDRVDLTAAATAEGGRLQQVALGVVRTGERARGEIRDLTVTPPQGPVWKLAAPARFAFDDAVTIDRLALEGRDQHLTLAGRVGLRNGKSDASLDLDAIRLTPICAMAGLPPCAGRVSGRLTLGGTPSAPVADLTAQGTRLRVREVDYGVLDLTAHAADARASLQATLTHPEAGDVRVTGEVPVDLAWGRPRRDLSGEPIAVTATATHLDLTMVSSLVPRQVESSGGRLSFDLRADGPWRSPRVIGELGVDEGQLELVAVGIPYENIHARVSANGTRLELREFHAEAGDGTADASGTVDLPLGGPGGIDLALALDKFFAVRREAYEAAVSGSLTAKGALDAPDLSGILDVDRAVVRPSGLPASEPTVARDPTIEVVGALTPPEPEVDTGPATTLAEPMRLALTVTIARNAWIRRDDADIEIAGELKVVKAPQEPVRITGQIRLVRGWYMFKGKRFTLQQGTITFTGGTPPASTFDITAIYRTSEYEIEVHITGSAEKPALTLSSSPPLEQADILAVLLFGKPSSQLGRGQSAALQEQALQMAAGYVIPELRTSVMNALGVDTLDVELPQGSDQAGRVSAGRYVADDVFLSLAQELGPRAAQEVGIEYDVGKNVSVRGSTTTRGTSAIDLFWHYRY